MTELEVMQRAKMYMDKLAQGIDPISNQEIPADSVLNNVRLARCFFYVSGVLEQVISNGGRVISAQNNFYITEEELHRVTPAQGEIRITQLVGRIMEAINDPGRKRLRTTVITDWLLEKGFLSKQEDAGGRQNRLPTAMGEKIGLRTRVRESQYGTYQTVSYSAEAQQFVLDHLMEMLQSDK